ncbi:MAG: rod shape-determining protein MreD [Chromatiaceae bacterium]|nr:MAG: rod shape-determining protein MreD [Chromatiaceae bacterium]
MSGAPPQGTGLILATLFVALCLSVLPMPVWASAYRPQWLALTLIFWTLTLPTRVGVFWAFGAGILQDVVAGSLLGGHALSLSVVAYLTLELHQRILPFPLWQQAVSVWLLLLLERLLSLWLLGAAGQPTPALNYWLPTFVGMLLWPWLATVLQRLRQRFRVGTTDQ